MYTIKSGLALVTLCGTVSGCAQVQSKEDMMAAAGFTMVPANTPHRLASLKLQPAHKFVHHVRNGRVIFTYADPTICDCLYIGDQAAYDRYRGLVFQKQLANQQEMTAQMNEEAGPMAWGGWGRGWYVE